MSFFSRELEIVQIPELEMTYQQFGIYCSLKNAYLRAGHSLTKQMIFRVIPCRSKEELNDLETVLNNCFYLEDERWVNADFEELLNLLEQEMTNLCELEDVKEKYIQLKKDKKEPEHLSSHSELDPYDKTTRLN